MSPSSLASALAIDMFRLIVWAVVLMLLFVPLERMFSLRRMPVFRRGFATDFGYYFINGMLPKWGLLLPMAALGALAHSLLPAAYTDWVAGWPVALRLTVMIVIGDIGAYWGHRMMHEVPALWRFHAVHHSSPEVDWLVNPRAHPFDFMIERMCGLLPIHMLGLALTATGTLDPLTLTYMLVGTLWSYFVHANVRWRFGWLEQLVATPAFHHWHHTNDSRDVVDKNYAAIFPWIDRLFGTLYLPRDRWPERYGTDLDVGPTLAEQFVRPFRANAPT